MVINQQQDQWFLYVLLGLSLIVSVIWYYIPERLTNIFSLSAKTILKKSGDKPAQIIFLAKHGFIVAGDSIDELKKLTRRVFGEIRRALGLSTATVRLAPRTEEQK